MWWFFLSCLCIIAFTTALYVKIKSDNIIEYLQNGGLLKLLIMGIFVALAQITFEKGIEYAHSDAIIHYINGDYEMITDEGVEPIYRIIPTDYD